MKKILSIVGISIAAGILWYAISPLFNEIEVQEEAPTSSMQDTGASVDDANVPSEETTATEEEMLTAFEAIPLGPFPIMDTPLHPASGEVLVFDVEGETTIRYENFETINGPNLHVYISKDLDATDYIDLGPIKGTKGNINYAVPKGTDLSEYKFVMYWCVPFSVLFNYAEIKI